MLQASERIQVASFSLTTFDLTDRARYYLKFNRIARCELMVIAVGLLSLWLYGLPVVFTKAEIAWSTGLWDNFLLQLLVLALIPPTTLFLIFTAVVRMGMGPIRLDVTDTGLVFTFSRHDKAEYLWNDPALNLNVIDHSGLPLANPLIAIKMIVKSRRAFIPPEALELVRNQAKRRGLSVTEKQEVDLIDRSRISRVICITSALPDLSQPVGITPKH